MNYRYHPLAKKELIESIKYYNECQDSLGNDFYNEILETISRIIAHPLSWTEISKNTRRCIVYRFPFGLVYNIKGEDLIILSVMHLHRKPGYWQDRS